MPEADKKFFDRPPRDPEAKDLLLYLGCNVLRTAHLAQTAITVLKAMGFDFNAVGGPAYCCGIWYKEQKLRGDPDATFEEVRATVEAQGLDPVRVREVLAKSFSPACETRLPNPS